MVKRIATLLLFFSTVAVSAQTREALVLNENTLIQGIDNRLRIVKVKGDSISTDNGEITIDINNTYRIKPAKTGACNIIFWQKKVIVKKSIFKVKAMPLPQVRFVGYKNGSNIPAAIAKVALGLTAELPYIEQLTCTGEIRFKIVNFDMIVVDMAGVHSIACTGNAFGAEASGLLQKCVPGQIIIFNDIIAETPVGRRSLESATFFIK